MVWHRICTLEKMSCCCSLMSTRCLKVWLLIVVVFSIASVFILKKIKSPETDGAVTHIQVFTLSRSVWEELHLCKSYSLMGRFRTNQRYVTCPSTTLDVMLSADVKHMKGQDAVVFNYIEEGQLTAQIKNLLELSTREGYMHQTWLFQALESAAYVRWSQPLVKSLPVHGIIGYHSSSTIRVLGGHYTHGDPLSDPKTEPIKYWMDKKMHMITWIASNCIHTLWPRLDFVKDLTTHIPVDVYGRCGPLTCLPRMSQKCLRVMESYKFFLSLENSECGDYVTEKFWNAVVHGIVPVVYGPRKDYYSAIAPPNSFIYAGDFASVEELAKYLLHLDKNDDEYVKYLEWRYTGRPEERYIEHCMLCDIPKIINNVSQGILKKRPLSETTYYNSCRPQKGGVEFNIHFSYSNWSPWK